MTKEGLTDKEKEEMKALQEIRKGAGNGGTVMSDSQRLRLSELLQKQGEAKEEVKKPTGTGTIGSSSNK